MNETEAFIRRQQYTLHRCIKIGWFPDSLPAYPYELYSDDLIVGHAA